MAEDCKHQFGRRRDKDGNLLGRGQRKCGLCGATEVLSPKTALVEIRRAHEEVKFGPAMRSLTDMQQRFVLFLMDSGSSNATEAAEAAGYSTNSNQALRQQGSYLMHDEKVQAAMREVGQARISGVTMKAIRTVEKALDSTDHKAALKAAEMVLNRAGLHATSEHKVTVEHITDEDKVARIKALAMTLGLDPSKLLGAAGVVIDADYTEVK